MGLGNASGAVQYSAAEPVPAAPIQAKLNDLEATINSLGDNVRKLAELLGPVRLYSPPAEERAQKGLAPVPNMSNLEADMVRIVGAAEEISALVFMLQSEVRL